MGGFFGCLLSGAALFSSMSNPHISGKIINHSHGQGTTSVDDIQQRAIELAQIDGRKPDEVNAVDLQEARRELTGGHFQEEEKEAELFVIGSDFVAGSTGHHVVNHVGDEYENAAEELVLEGMEEAVHEQMLEASALELDAEEE